MLRTQRRAADECLLALLLPASLLTAVSAPATAQAADAVVERKVNGRSVNGKPIVALRLGEIALIDDGEARFG